MAGLGQGLAGAGAGFATGGPVGAAIGGVLGLLGGSNTPQLSPQQKALAQQQQQIAQRLMQYGTSAPGAAPDEMQSLAQDRGVLGQQQRNQQQALFANMGNPAQAQPYIQDFLKNVSSQQTGQQMALDEQHMMDALSRRREALLQAANVGQSAYQMAQPGAPPSQLPQLMGQLSQALAYRKAIRQGQNTSGNTSSGGNATAPTIPYAPPPLANQYDYTAQDYNNQYDNGTPDPNDTSIGGGGLGDDPILAAVLHVLAKHGYKIAKDKPKGKGKSKKAKVGDDPQMAAMQAMMAGQAPATGGMMGGQQMGQGAQAPGNGMYDVNSQNNQMRQSGGYGYRLMHAPGGQVYSY